jgi:ribonucleotide monophosphatase NagD (HAD superfamily)
MRDFLFANTGWEMQATTAVGDRLTTDVALAKAHGFTGLLVLSGATGKEEADASAVKADWVFNSVKEIIPFL